jgi:DNA invertase Pin-like site-specific DNA recombinase
VGVKVGNNMLVGYARISTQDQNLELQFSALNKVGCEKIHQDPLPETRNNRARLQLILEGLRKGDTLVVWKLDRLGLTVKGLIDLITQFHQKGIHFKSITDNLDTATPSGHFFFHIMSSFAQMEKTLMAERTRVGLIAAKSQGKMGGRKRKMTQSKIESAKNLLASGILPKDVAHHLGISVPTLYRWIPASKH